MNAREATAFEHNMPANEGRGTDRGNPIVSTTNRIITTRSTRISRGERDDAASANERTGRGSPCEGRAPRDVSYMDINSAKVRRKRLRRCGVRSES